MARVWIAGCGDLGRATGTLLAASGHEVLGLRRRPPGGPEAAGFEYAAADLTDPGSLAALPGEPDRLVYTPAAPARSEGDYRATYLRGLENILASLAERGCRPERLVFVSSTAVYGEVAGEWVDETTPCHPDEFRGRTLRAAEETALDVPGGHVARLAGIYGPGRTALLRRVREGRACRPGRFGNRIHRDDAARMLVHMLIGNPGHRVMLGVDDEPAPECEVMTWLADRMGVPAPAVDETAESGRGNKRCANGRLRASGFEFRYPTFREGYGAMLEEERQ